MPLLQEAAERLAVSDYGGDRLGRTMKDLDVRREANRLVAQFVFGKRG